ncbi:MAG: hypothetical protein JXA11_02885 [Phycisphaerae bacterium]|nr:hypothetical protein [Phycisphaerae bacterium]
MTKPKIGILALTLELYESIAPSIRPGREAWVRRAVIPALEPLADVCFDRAVYRAEDIQAVVRGYENDGCDALLVLFLSYSPSLVCLPALQQTSLPILVWNTQELSSVDESFGSRAMLDNHGLHGTQDLCNVLLRNDVPFEYVTSHLSDGNALETLKDFCMAAATRSAVRNATVGLIGYPFPGMGDILHEKNELASALGTKTLEIPITEYNQYVEAADPKRTAELVRTYRDSYEIDAGVTEAELRATARSELAVRRIVVSHKLAGLSYQFLAFDEKDRAETLPFVAVSRLMAEGVGFAGEGDVAGAAGTFLLHCLRPPASFVEMFTVDFEHNGVFLSHMGEINVAMARKDRRPRLVAKNGKLAETKRRHVTFSVSLEPGPATFTALCRAENGAWRIVSSPVRIDDFGPLPSLEVPHARLLPARGDVRDFLTAYAKAGGPHHAALCFGDARQRLGYLAGMMHIDYVEV